MTEATARPPLTRQLAEFVAGLRYESIPADAVPIVCAGFADTVGVMTAGAVEPVVALVRDSTTPLANRGARACLTDLRLDATDAALVGGTAAHALDYDDVAMSSHPSAVLVPAILAEAEMLGSSGKDLVTAYVAGFEVWADLFARNRDYHRKGWHPTAIFGPVAAAAAVARLHGLDVGATVNALALGATQAGGLVANFGSMSKPFHAGLAARNAIAAVRLARSGMTGSGDALEHPQGYLAAIAPFDPPDLERPVTAGRDWQILRRGLNVKRYPTCYATHRSIDAMLDLAEGNDLKAGQIASIEVRMGATQAAALRNARPATGLEAKFSEEFAMACAIVRRRVGLAELTDDVVADPEIRSLFDKVHTITVTEQDPDDPTFSPTEDVTVLLNDGRRLETLGIRYPKGHARNPMSADELFTKFADCLAQGRATSAARPLYSALVALQSLAGTAAIPTIACGGEP